ncbi:PepSY domain-containing protein [Sphingomonas sp.]|uniref:PepSY domain-containing protein n=1 Tax=Sphingomonas sp. TaxID=28214 RepID=UPI00389D2DCA
MRKLLCFTAAASLGATGAMAATGGGRFAGSELLPLAKVSLAQARATATASRPGRITDQELEKESGGTGLRYSFDIKSAGKTFEVGVDARTGKVLENKSEGANPD